MARPYRTWSPAAVGWLWLAACSSPPPRPTPQPRVAPASPAPAAEVAWLLRGYEDALAPALRMRLQKDAYAFFRFINLRFSERVCQRFARESASLPTVNLHGDAHVQQFAAVADYVGLLDFDDASLGPAVIDIVRFGVSLELACRESGLECGDRPLDAFLEGYRLGTKDPVATVPSEGEVLGRMRARVREQEQDFLGWVEERMAPLEELREPEVMSGYERYVSTVRARHPELPPSFFELKRYGALGGGIGSAHVNRILARIEGPSAAPEDDVVLEFKELRDLSPVSCVVARKGDALRVVVANSRIGGRDDAFLAIVPRGLDESADDRPWWGQSWDQRYSELDVGRDVRSVSDLEEVALAAGQQLGRGHCVKVAAPFDEELRREQLRMLEQQDRRIRAAVRDLTAEVLEAHAAIAQGSP